MDGATSPEWTQAVVHIIAFWNNAAAGQCRTSAPQPVVYRTTVAMYPFRTPSGPEAVVMD